MPKLILYRTGSFAGRLRSFTIIIDGKETDAIKAKETKEIELTAGDHTLQIKFGWNKSDIREIHLSEIKKIELGVNKFYIGSMFFLLLVILSRKFIPGGVFFKYGIGVGFLVMLYFATWGRRKLITFTEKDCMD